MTVDMHPASHRRSLSPPARAPDQDSDIPASLGRAYSHVYSHSGLASARSNTLAFVLPIGAILAPPLQGRPRRSARDPQIPIGRSSQEPFLPAVSSLAGFRAPAPAHAPTVANGRRPKPFTKAVVAAHAD